MNNTSVTQLLTHSSTQKLANKSTTRTKYARRTRYLSVALKLKQGFRHEKAVSHTIGIHFYCKRCNSEVIGISSKVLESFKAGNAELYETLVRDLSKNIERQQSTIDIEHRLEHCENFFNGVSENKQDIAHLNLKAFNVLMEYR